MKKIALTSLIIVLLGGLALLPTALKIKDLSSLYYWIENSENSQIESLFAGGFDPNLAPKDIIFGRFFINYTENPPLLDALFYRNFEAVKILLENGADYHVTTEGGFTPLWDLSSSCQTDLVKMILEKGVDVKWEEELHSPLNPAIKYGCWAIFEELLSYGFDINHYEKAHGFPLTTAIAYYDTEKVKKVLQYNPDLTKVDENNTSFYGIALSTGNKEMVELLTKNGVQKTEEDEKFFLYCILRDLSADTSIIELNEDVIWLRNAWEDTPLLYAIKTSRFEFVKRVIELYGCMDQRTSMGLDPVHVATSFGETEILKYLVSAGYSLDSTDLRGENALHMALRNRDSDLAIFLIDQGVDVTTESIGFDTPLDMSLERQMFRVTERILRNKNLVNDRFFEDKNSLLFAVWSKSCDLVKKCLDWRPLSARQISLERQAQLVLLSIDKKDLCTTQVLVANGFYLGFLTEDGYSPAEYAKHLGYNDIYDFLNNAK